jgi:hypothetical protein
MYIEENDVDIEINGHEAAKQNTCYLVVVLFSTLRELVGTTLLTSAETVRVSKGLVAKCGEASLQHHHHHNLRGNMCM